MMLRDLYNIFKKTYKEFYHQKLDAKKKIENIKYAIIDTNNVINDLGKLYNLLNSLKYNIFAYERESYVVPLIDVFDNGPYSYSFDKYGELYSYRYAHASSLIYEYKHIKERFEYYLKDMKEAYKRRNFDMVNTLYEEWEKSSKNFNNMIQTNVYKEAKEKHERIMQEKDIKIEN